MLDNNQRVYAASVANKGKLCLSIVDRDQEYRDTILLVYDENFEKKWTRYNVTDRVISIACSPVFSEPVYYGLAASGSIFVFGRDDSRVDSCIANLVFSDENLHRGRLRHIACFEQQTYVVGSDSRVYVSDLHGEWLEFDTRELSSPPGFEPNFYQRVARSRTDLYLCGYSSPIPKRLTEANLDEIKRAAQLGDIDRVQAIYASVGRAGVQNKDVAFKWNVFGWTKILPDVQSTFNDIHIDPDGLVWIAGSNGLLAFERFPGFFEVVDLDGFSKNIISFTSYRGSLILATDLSLYRILDDSMDVFLPSTGIFRSLYVTSVDDTLYYFTYDGEIYTHDDTGWSSISIPAAAVQKL